MMTDDPMSASATTTTSQIQARRDLVFLVLAGLFLGTLGMLNILGLTRFLALGKIGSWPIVVAVGALPYPVTFLCTDLISELWGEERATQLVWVGLLLNGWVVLILWVGGLMPGLNGAPESTFFEIQRLAFGSIGASMAAYLTAQFVDVRLFHFWKQRTNGKALWLRNNGSTLVSQLVDTSAVVLISHYAASVGGRRPHSSSSHPRPSQATLFQTSLWKEQPSMKWPLVSTLSAQQQQMRLCWGSM